MNCDVVIVGACTAGTYFSKLLAQRGLKVVVIDKEREENLCRRLDIFHFTRDSYEAFGLPESREGDEEFVRNFDKCYTRSALDNYPKTDSTKVAVLHLPLFIKRLREQARAAGVEFLFGEEFDRVKYDGGRIAGIVTKSGRELTARLVVDASGIPSVVRRSLDDPFMEGFEIGPRDKFYVLLKYVRLKNPEDRVELSTSWPYYKGWIAPQHDGEGAIIGVGASLSYDYARKCMAKFEGAVKLPPYELQYEELGCTPYCRPPYSFVTDGFLVIGDAACLTKPWNGEGVPSAWVQCTPAADVVSKAMADGAYPTREALWPINVLYQRGEGRAFAATRAMLIGAVQMSAQDNDFLFQHSIVFKSDDEPDNPHTISTLLRGVATGRFSRAGLKALLSGLRKGKKLDYLYARYPSTPVGYPGWKLYADELWAKVGTMADTVTDADAGGV